MHIHGKNEIITVRLCVVWLCYLLHLLCEAGHFLSFLVIY